ncbi:hypothetical protein ASF57_12500 [Methylobacterium sp. Leaf117]|nr:hypothetical protein ASF57_12500 [Methylobacterium sp. Leaf117]
MLPLLPETLPPDEDALVELLAGMLGEQDLRFVAQADYGYDADEHLMALRRLLDGGALDLGQGKPTEVLEFTRWDRPQSEPGQEQRHWRRAFACAALLRAYGRPENRHNIIGSNQSIAGLIDSLYALGQILPLRERQRAMAGIDAAGTALMAWLIPHLPSGPDEEAAFHGVGLLWFALACEVRDTALVAVAEWVMVADDEATAPWRPYLGDWLLGTTRYAECHDLWRLFGARLPSRLSPRHGTEVVEAVRLISTMISRPQTD